MLKTRSSKVIVALISITLVVVFVYFATRTTYTAPGVMTLDVLMDTIYSDRQQFSAQALDEEQISAYLYPFTDLLDADTLAQLAYSGESPQSLKQKFLLTGKINVDEAKADVDILFAAFKYSYCLYQYYGGDAAFEQAKTELLAAIENQANNQQTISKRAFRDLLLEHLGFIQDGHVVIAGESLLQRQRFFYSERMLFARDASGYYTMRQGQRYDVKAITAPDMYGTVTEDFLKLTLNKDGELVYMLGITTPYEERRLPVNLTLIGKDGEYEELIILRRKSDITLSNDTTYRRSTEQGITVVINRNTAPSTEAMKADLDAFVADAAELANEDIVILDIRDHAGGQWTPALQWTEAFAGQPITYDQHDAKVRTRTALTLQHNFVEWYLRDNEERRIMSLNYIRNQLNALDPFDPDTSVIWTVQHTLDTQMEQLPNDTLIIVLMNRGTASAGEDFITFLRQLDNVILVGENTKGLGISGEPAWGTLPNSGLSFQLTLDATLTAGWEEGMGYSPDIWVNSNQALKRVLRMLEQE